MELNNRKIDILWNCASVGVSKVLINLAVCISFRGQFGYRGSELGTRLGGGGAAATVTGISMIGLSRVLTLAPFVFMV